MNRKCFQCEAENSPELSFCGRCGAALLLKDFVSQQVSKELATAVRDRDMLETESAIRVFERAWGWANLVGRIVGVTLGVAIAIIITLAGWVGWRDIDFSKTTESAKQSVITTANRTSDEIKQTSSASVADIQKAARNAIEADRQSAEDAAHLSKGMQRAALQTRSELKGEAASVRSEVSQTKTELDAIKTLQPEFNKMRSQLAETTAELETQRKTLASSEEFVKQVFSTHVSYQFTFPKKWDDKNASNSPDTPFIVNSVNVKGLAHHTGGATSTVVYMLVPYTPIDGTLQLQFQISVQPPESYFFVHNLIVFFWGDAPETLGNHPLNVSFYPDKSDKEIIKTISFHGERVFADDQPMPMYRDDDPNFTGNKWIPDPHPVLHNPGEADKSQQTNQN